MNPSTDSLAEAKTRPELKLDQQLIAINTCKQSCTTQHSFHSEMFALLLLFSFGGEFARVEVRYKGMERLMRLVYMM